MRIFRTCVLAAFMLPVVSQAQDFLGYLNSNYAGVNGLDLNPSSIVDSRYKADILLGGFSFNLTNNYMGIKKDAFANRVGPLLPPDSTSAWPAFSDPDFAKKYLFENLTGKTNSVFLSNQIALPSFMFSINEKNGFSITQYTLRKKL